MSMHSARHIDTSGWTEIKDNPISKVGVFQYLGKTFRDLPGIDAGKIYNVYRPQEELSNPETIDSFKLIPWIDDHEMIGPNEKTPAEKKGISGVIGENVYFEYPYLKGNLKIFSDEMQEKIDRQGKKELSPGYRALYRLESGVYDGKPYDVVQYNIRGNHLALVHEGRTGADVSVLDEVDTMTEQEELREKKTADDDGENHLMGIHECLKQIKELLSVHAEDRKVKDEKSEMSEEEARSESTKGEINKEKADDLKKTDDNYGALESVMDSQDIRIISKKIAERDNLAKSIAKCEGIGTFDYSEMNVDDVAKYGVNKLGLKCSKGQEKSAIQGYLFALKSMPTTAMRPTVDRKEPDSQIESILAGKY
jgi:uncharacterized protein